MEVTDRSADYAMLALQGPEAIAIARRRCSRGQTLPAASASPRRRSPAPRRSSAAPATRARTASSCCSRPTTRRRVWDALADAGATPAGLGARDTLRLEVCYPLYGNDLSTERTPIEAGLDGRARSTRTSSAPSGCASRPSREPPRSSCRSCSPAPGIPRAGCPVLRGGEPVGVVTSGTLSPCLEVGIGMAYVRSDLAEPGTEIEVDVRGKHRAARVAVEAPLQRRRS